MMSLMPVLAAIVVRTMASAAIYPQSFHDFMEEIVKPGVEVQRSGLPVRGHEKATNLWRSLRGFLSQLGRNLPSRVSGKGDEAKPAKDLSRELAYGLFANSMKITDACEELSARRNWTRYEPLRGAKYFIAIDLFNNELTLADLTLQLLKLVDFLGPGSVFLSIYENGSSDHTKEYLMNLDILLGLYGVAHRIVMENQNRPGGVHRIEYLAAVRNRALEPLAEWSSGDEPKSNSKIVFLNDVYICDTDILELLRQSTIHDADITCGLDYSACPENNVKCNGWPFWFYDTWVSRSIDGSTLFYPSYNPSQHEETKRRFSEGLPAQVACCWNGAAVLNPKPFLQDGVRFRRGELKDGECSGSECTLLCKDFWELGWDRIMVVPAVKISYGEKNIAYEEIVKLRRFEYDILGIRDQDGTIDWTVPQGILRCDGMRGYERLHPDLPDIRLNLRTVPSRHLQ
mmetsp:Transcript_24964/g.61768  ORF Transcript_24964/g.61768 Transcript_24964/m.61768 type:complete len:457 (-) Transcript_24964:151-1521(-)